MSDVVFAFSYLSWGAASRRGWFGTEDRLARGLVGHHRVHRLLECDRARSLPLKLARDVFDAPDEPFPASAHAQLLSPIRLRRTDPCGSRSIIRAFARYEQTMQRAAARMGLRDPVVITTHPLLAGMADLSWARAVTYYAIDDWAVHPGYRRWWNAYRESYEGIRMRGRRVAAVSDTLLSRLAPAGPARVVANGLEPAEWLGDPAPPTWAATTSRPLIVYVGSLDQRLDLDVITRLAAEIPGAAIVLVGPMVSPRRYQAVRLPKNVSLRSPLTRRELTGLIRVADLGVIPHVRSPLTEAMSPLKAFEYLAGGLPVVATDLPPIRGIHARVELVQDDQSFGAAAQAALARGRLSEPDRLSFIEQNSWSARHDALLDLALA
jgi:glycosyltransferase involved in cell wall biosynthesis